MSRFGRCWRKEGAGMDAEPVSAVVPVVWASCSSMMLSEGLGDVSGESGPTRWMEVELVIEGFEVSLGSLQQ